MSNPVRVLQVFAEMNRGGAETMIMNLYRNIDRSKIQFDFIVHTEEKCAFDEEIVSLGGSIYYIPRYSGKNHLQYKKAWNVFFEEHPQYKLIHGHVRSTAAIYLNIAKKYNLLTISHSHSISSGKGISALVKNILQYPIRNIADHLVACSQEAGEWLFGKKACSQDNFFILNNAIEVNSFVFNSEIRVKKREEFNLKEKFVIGHVGRLIPLKNHEFLIDTFKEVHDINKSAVLLLVGEGELQEHLKKKVNKLGLNENVIFAGARFDVHEILQAMDVFVFPSLYEGLGIVLIEAQASGLPCVVTETIPKEAIVTSLVKTVSLRGERKEWVNIIHQYSTGYERKNTLKDIKNVGFDVQDSSIWLQEFYLGLVEENETRICI